MSIDTRIPIVFLHGIAGDARLWLPQLESFAARGYMPVTLNLLGYGARPPVEQLTFDELAADLEQEVAKLGLDRPVLVGHSFGGMIAQTALQRRRDSYRAAVLVGTSPAFGNPEGEFQQRFVQARLGPLDAGRTMRDMAPAIVDAVFGPDGDAEGRAHATAVIAGTPPQTYRAAVHCLVGFDGRANLPYIRIPVLCMAGERDNNAPPHVADRMAQKIPGAQFVQLPGLGHLPNLENPALFDAAVFEFLDRALANAEAETEPHHG